ncbi:hypothetical protein F4776DRAFT_662762 [Hypoxylon sp. NC0597]|nr:hypothetical protein F4776DRAFT_662762 [Hypoxylon sp. NC0597]
MAEDVTPSLPRGNNRYTQNLMINYAFDNYQYIITPRESEEIVARPFWDDVDDFINYMMEINFGEAIPGTSNVNLPSTIRVYTDDELNALDAGLVELPNTTRPGTHTNEVPGTTETNSTVIYNEESNTNYELHITNIDEDIFDEDLPRYTPTMLPPYSPYNSTEHLSDTSLEDQGERAPEYDTYEEHIPREVNLEEDIHEGGRLDDTTGSTPITKSWRRKEFRASILPSLYTFGSRIDEKLQKAKQKLARGIEVIAPRKAFSKVQKIKKRIRLR